MSGPLLRIARRERPQVLIILAFNPAVIQLAAFVRFAAVVLLKFLVRADREEGPVRQIQHHFAKLAGQLLYFLVITDALPVRGFVIMQP